MRPIRILRNMRPQLVFAMLTLVLAGCGAGSGQGLDANGRPVAPGTQPVPLIAEFSSIQANVFTPICTACHVGSQAPLGLRLDAASSFALLVNVASSQEPGLLRVAPGDPDNSYLIQKVEGTAGTGARMPLGLPPLPQATIDVMRAWIAAGAQPPAGPLPPPAVVSMTPEEGTVVTVLPANLQVIFNAELDASLISASTVQLQRAGGDAIFDNGNDVGITPAAIGLAAGNAAQLLVDLSGVASIDDVYRLRLVGTGATALAGPDGQLIDGDGDGTAGGDYVAQFSVSAVEATLESIQVNVFATSCALSGCHSGPSGPDLPEGQDLTTAARSFASLVGVTSVEVPSLQRVNAGNADASYLVQKIEGTAEIGDRMPLGGDPLPPAAIDAIRRWIDNGAPFDGEPADTSPPSVSVNQPSSPVSGTVTFSAVAADNVSVTQVDFFVNGTSVGVDEVSPYMISWDSTQVSDGEHNLSARAADAAGNTGDSQTLSFTVDNRPVDVTPPSVALTAPVATSVGGLVTIAASADDDVGIAEVRFSVDGLLLAVDTVAPFAADWDTTLFSDGLHRIGATAIDTSGNATVATAIDVTVDNGPSDDVIAPVVDLTAPSAGVVAGIVTVAADASDETGVTEVRFFAGIDFIGADAEAPYSAAWDTTLAADGEVQLTAEAADAAGNTGFSSPVTVTVNNTAPVVTDIMPGDGAMLDALPAALTAVFSEAIDPATVTTLSFELTASGGDGSFADGNEVRVTPAGVSSTTATTATMDLTGVDSVPDAYRITLNDTITDVHGLALDGDNDGSAGGIFTAGFTITAGASYSADVQPIFAEKCAPCHTGLGFGGHDIGTSYSDAFIPADDSSCDGLNVGQCTIVRIRSGEMPRGRGCTGDPVADAANDACLTQDEQDTIQSWIDAGLPE